MVLETAPGTDFEHVTIQNGAQVLEELAIFSFQRMRSHQLRNGAIPASVGNRQDDPSFADDMVWSKDHFRATRFALNSLVQQYIPQLKEPGKNLYLRANRGMLKIQAQPEQRARYASRPGEPDEEGYSTIDDKFAPAIKFTKEGYIYHDWGHNQPDNTGTLLLETGKGIEADWPVLRRGRDGFVPGDILQDVISYAVNLRVERFRCRSIWEHDNVRSSYSTRRIVLAGLQQMEKIWPELVLDSKYKGYRLQMSLEQLQQATGSLEERVLEYDGDITDSAERHPSTADLASMVVLNDVENLPIEEEKAIIRRVQEAELENRLGFYRFQGDHWKQGWTEAKWTMGKPIMARYYFKKALEAYKTNHPDVGFRALDHGLDRINDLVNLYNQYGYIPELIEDEDRDGIPSANNNELAWTHGYIVETAGAGKAAIDASKKYPLRKAA